MELVGSPPDGPHDLSTDKVLVPPDHLDGFLETDSLSCGSCNFKEECFSFSEPIFHPFAVPLGGAAKQMVLRGHILRLYILFILYGTQRLEFYPPFSRTFLEQL